MADTVRTDPARAAVIPAAPAIGGWAIGWVGGPFLASTLVLLAVNGGLEDPSVPSILVATASGWAVFVATVVWVSRRFGSGELRRDLGIELAPRDALALPVGVLTQLVVVPAVYQPLRHWWPDVFTQTEIEERAQDLVDRAGGFDTVLLVVLVVVGAPIVEELVYRGLLQRSIGREMGGAASLVMVSLGFALVHFSPVEIPGLFVAGLVFGGGVVLTGRLGPAILAHAAFNATGLVILLS